MRIDEMRGLIVGGTRGGRQAGTANAARDSGGLRGGGWVVVLGLYLMVYVSWLLWDWIPFDAGLVGHVMLEPINVVAAWCIITKL